MPRTKIHSPHIGVYKLIDNRIVGTSPDAKMMKHIYSLGTEKWNQEHEKDYRLW